HALHLATEVGVAGGVEDVDAVAAPGDGGVLGQDGDAALLFLVVAVHDPLGQHGAFGKGAGLLQELVDKGGLAIVDVGDDGDIAQVRDGHDFWDRERRTRLPEGGQGAEMVGGRTGYYSRSTARSGCLEMNR